MIHQCQNKHIERINSGVLKFFDLSTSNLNDAAEPKYFPTRLHILYHFIQFGSHASRGPPKCRNVMVVTAIFMVCRIHLAIM